MPLVDIPNVGEVEFPDDMSEDDIVLAIQRDIIRDVMPRVSAPGESEMLRAGTIPGAPTQAFPAVEERMAETAKVPALSGEEAEQALTTPYAEVPQALAEAPGAALSQLPGAQLAAGLFPEAAAGARSGIANLTKGLVEQSLLTPLSGPMAAATLVPGLRAGLGAVLSAGAAKGAAEKLGEGSVTGDPQTITEGLGMGGLALLGGVGTGLDIARSRPGAFVRDVIAESKPARPIDVELVRPPRPGAPGAPAGAPPPTRPLLPGPARPQLPAGAAPEAAPPQTALLPRTAAVLKQLTEGTQEGLTPVQKQATLGRASSREPNVISTRTQAESGLSAETASNDVAAVARRNEEAANAWLKAVERNDPQAISNATEELLRQPLQGKAAQEKILDGADGGGAALRTSGDYGATPEEGASEIGMRPSQGRQRPEQQPGQLGTGKPGLSQSPTLQVAAGAMDEAARALQELQGSESEARGARTLQTLLSADIPTEVKNFIVKEVYAFSQSRAKTLPLETRTSVSPQVGEEVRQQAAPEAQAQPQQAVTAAEPWTQPLFYGDVSGRVTTTVPVSQFGDYGKASYVTPDAEFARTFAEGTAFSSKPKGSGKVHHVQVEPPQKVFAADRTPLTSEEVALWERNGEDMKGITTREQLVDNYGGRAVGQEDLRGISETWDEFLDQFGYDAVWDGQQLALRKGGVRVNQTATEQPPAPPAQAEAGGAAPPSNDPPSDQALGFIPPVPPIIKDIASGIGAVLDWYSLPLTERLAAAGGPTAKGFSNMAKEMVYRQKALYGSLTPILDPALRATGRLNRTTTWLNDIAPTTKKWGYRNSVAAIEGPISAVPIEHQPTVKLLKDANLATGQMAQPVIPGFTATGLMQRNLTAAAVDAIRSGKGPLLDGIIEALSTDNHIPISRVQKLFADFKAEFDAPGSKQTISRISQEFHRHFKKFPTDIRITIADLGHKRLRASIWVPVLHAKPFEYLSHSALETSQRVAFLERIPQGSLAQIRKQVVAELKDPAPFDDLVRALHGLSVDQPWRFAPPGTALHLMLSGIDRVLSDVFGELKLSASAIVNIPETIIGNTPAFYGWRNFSKGATSLPARHQALEILGAIDLNMYNWSLDPKAPMRTILAGFRYGMRKLTMRQFFNELQEKSAASTAQVFGALAKGRLLSTREQGLFIEVASAMGFSRQASEAMAKGHATPEQYDDFTRRAAPFATGGHSAPAERSKWANTRIITSLVKWQNYPQMKMNSGRKAWESFADAIESGDKARAFSAGEILSKYLFNTTAQGVGATFLAALFMGRKGGVVETIEDALDGPGAFMLDSFLTGMAGPFAAIHYAFSSGRMRDVLDPRNLNSGLVFPGAITLELKQLFNREGPYAGMTMTEAIERYAKVKVPAGRVIVRALRAAGAVDEADDSTAEIYQRIRLWREKSEDLAVARQREQLAGQKFPESKYAALKQALKVNDRPRAREEYRALRKIQDSDVIKRTMEANRPFTGSWELERKFRRSLDAEGRKLYRDAQRERDRLAARFRAIAP